MSNMLSPNINNAGGQGSGTHDSQTATGCIQRLKHLKTLYDNDLITQDDFETRKSQIVDELTGTSSGLSLRHSQRKRSTFGQNTLNGSTINESKSDSRGPGYADPMNIVLADNNNNNNNNNNDGEEERPKRKKSKKKRLRLSNIHHPIGPK
eukprot:543813_1